MSDMIAYPAMDGLKVRFDGETVWLTQKQMAMLFGCNTPNINKHLTQIYADGEIDKASTVSKMEIVDIEGKRTVTRTVRCYNLDAIISVGYRVNSKRGVQFRQWATRTLKERLLRGYVPRPAPRVLPYEEADAEAVRRALESNLRRVLGRDDLGGVAAFVESSVAEGWLLEARADIATARLLGTAGRLECVVAPMLSFPGVWHPLHALGLMCVGSAEARRAVLLGTGPVFMVRRDCVTGAEAYVEWRRGEEAATADAVFHALAGAQGTLPAPAAALPAPAGAAPAKAVREAVRVIEGEMDRVGWAAVNAALPPYALSVADYAKIAEESKDGSPEFATVCGVRMDRAMRYRVARAAGAADVTPLRLVGGILRGCKAHERLRETRRALRAWHASQKGGAR